MLLLMIVWKSLGKRAKVQMGSWSQLESLLSPALQIKYNSLLAATSQFPGK